MDISHRKNENLPIETSHSSPGHVAYHPPALAPLTVELEHLHAAMGAWPSLILHLALLTWHGQTMAEPWPWGDFHMESNYSTNK